jgi:O-antigen ligase
MIMILELLFNTLFFVIPFIFFPKTSEVFEFNKLIVLYIFTVLIIGVWVIKIVRTKKFIFRRTLLDIPILLFLGSQILSTIFSVDLHTSIFGFYGRWNGGLISIICYCLLYWAYVSNITAHATRKIIISTLIAGVIVSIYGILEHYGHSASCLLMGRGFGTDCFVQDVQSRVFATFGQPNWLAAFVAILLPLSIANIKIENSKKNCLWILVSIILFLALVFTKSRSGLIAFGVASVIYWILNLRSNFEKTLPKLLILNIIFVGIFFAFNPFKAAPPPSTAGPALESGGTESFEIRKIVWQGAIDMWRYRPIFGMGVETFGLSYSQFKPVAHNATSEWDFLYNKAHNEYLNFAATTGTVGLLSYLVLIFFSLKQIFKNPALLAAYVTILITNFSGFSVVVTSLLFFIIPAWGVTLETKKSFVIKLAKNYRKFLVGFTVGVCLFLLFMIGKYWTSDLNYAQGVDAAAQGKYQEAVDKMVFASDSVPNEAIYHNDLGRLYYDIAGGLSDQNEATASAEFGNAALYEAQTALVLQPRNMNIIRSAAGILAGQGYVTDSIQLLEDTIKIAPTDPRLYYNLGRGYLRINEKQKAIDAFKKALELKPDYDEVKTALQSVK